MWAMGCLAYVPLPFRSFVRAPPVGTSMHAARRNNPSSSLPPAQLTPSFTPPLLLCGRHAASDLGFRYLGFLPTPFSAHTNRAFPDIQPTAWLFLRCRFWLLHGSSPFREAEMANTEANICSGRFRTASACPAPHHPRTKFAPLRRPIRGIHALLALACTRVASLDGCDWLLFGTGFGLRWLLCRCLPAAGHQLHPADAAA